MSWPRKPPKNTRCDAHVGWHSDSCGAPVLERCPNMAEETVTDGGVVGEVWLCIPHAESMAEKGKVKRNPRLFPAVHKAGME